MLTFAVLLAIATVLSVAFVDRPVARLVAGHVAWWGWFRVCAAPSLLALPVAGVGLVLDVVGRLRGDAGIARVWRVASVATLAGTAAKDELKWIFGRPWPQSWLHYGIYRFHPFTDGFLFGGFPSGHTAYIAAPMCVLWVLVPRFRVVWAGVTVLVMLGLVGAGYHFVGDVLAGLLTGVLCAWATLVLMGHSPHQGSSVPS